MTYIQVYLPYIATIERAKNNVVYPAGATIVQISATKGQTEYINKPSKLGSHYVVLRPTIEINPKYFYLAIKNSVPKFLHSYQNGLNVKVEDFKHIKILIEDDIDIQNKQVKEIEIFDRAILLAEKELSESKNFKTSMLSKLFV